MVVEGAEAQAHVLGGQLGHGLIEGGETRGRVLVFGAGELEHPARHDQVVVIEHAQLPQGRALLGQQSIDRARQFVRYVVRAVRRGLTSFEGVDGLDQVAGVKHQRGAFEGVQDPSAVVGREGGGFGRKRAQAG